MRLDQSKRVVSSQRLTWYRTCRKTSEQITPKALCCCSGSWSFGASCDQRWHRDAWSDMQSGSLLAALFLSGALSPCATGNRSSLHLASFSSRPYLIFAPPIRFSGSIPAGKKTANFLEMSSFLSGVIRKSKHRGEQSHSVDSLFPSILSLLPGLNYCTSAFDPQQTFHLVTWLARRRRSELLQLPSASGDRAPAARAVLLQSQLVR